MDSSPPIRVAILWHMHQPSYQLPGSNILAMPWVRLHALKDYLDMPLLAAKYENVKVTFNLVPSLIDQIELYTKGGSDRHLELSRANPDELTGQQKLELLDSFFDANPANMIEPYPRYHSLFRKSRRVGASGEDIDQLFSSSELRDLQVWSNLVWIDPMFRRQDPLSDLYSKQRDFTESDKKAMLDWQIELLGKILPTYRRLFEENRIDVSFTPYYHPILPLLCDTDSALEAVADMALPKNRFRHPEDAARQVQMSADKYSRLFGRPMSGMWPSEGSISEEVLRIAAEQGIQWLASDEDVLRQSAAKAGLPQDQYHPHTLYQHESGAKLFFRDHSLSDKIGFVYSGWPAKKAVDEFVSRIRSIRKKRLDELEHIVLPVILDGENAWEYFPDDGHAFLTELYQRLSEDDQIEMVTMTEASRLIQGKQLPRIQAGSWINHDFRIWIGHEEDNAAWDLLSRARETLVDFEKANPEYDSSRIAEAWQQIFIAEGSDWCWWYGDEHRGNHNARFDLMFRRHLIEMYSVLGLDIPESLTIPIHAESVTPVLCPPDNFITPLIDGRQSHYYEWSGAGWQEFHPAGGSMHRVEQALAGIGYGYDRQRLYIRLDFRSKKNIELLQRPRLTIELVNEKSEKRKFEVNELSADSHGGETDRFTFAVGEIVELAVERPYIWTYGFGKADVSVSLHDGMSLVERWPQTDRMRIEVPEQNKELFWPA